MNNEIQVFNHEQFGQIRICQNEGKEWFCLSDVCKALEINNPRDVKKRLQQRGVVAIDTPTYNQHGTMVLQKMTYIDEANLYRCIFQSRKQEAEQFQNWVFEVVLPQIRRTGGYIPVGRDENEASIMAKALLIAQKTIVQKDQQIEEQRPVVEYCEDVLRSEDCVTTTQIAKMFGLSAKALNRKLHELEIEFWQSGQWHLYARFAKMGLTQSRTAPYFDSEGRARTAVTMVWTERGKRFVSELIRCGYDVRMALNIIRNS